MSVILDAQHWAQVGWRYYSGYSEPKMYCEWHGGQYRLVEFSLTHVTHRYKIQYDTLDQGWDCFLDGTWKYFYLKTYAQLSSGPRAQAQGEAHQTHVQIGKMNPGRLLFSDMQYRRQDNLQWPALDIVILGFVDPYDASEPAFGQMQMWTNSH